MIELERMQSEESRKMAMKVEMDSKMEKKKHKEALIDDLVRVV